MVERMEMRRPGARGWAALCCQLVVMIAAGCEEQAASSFSFYEDRIHPILDVGCQRQTTGCHVDDGRGFALGNLDLTSYDALMRRRDVLTAYGPYSVGALLLKAGNPIEIDVRTIDPPDPAQPERRRVSVVTDIRHAAGEGAIARGSSSYSTLKQWIDGGHTRTGVPSRTLTRSVGDCVNELIEPPGIDLTGDPLDPASFERFVEDVQPILRARCAGGSCHGNPLADLYLTCGDNSRELRLNYELAVRFLDEVPASSELVRRPLAQLAGGVYHEGGDVFADVSDPEYRELLGWAAATVERTPELLEFGPADEGLRFFGNRVQPVLVRKGCMFLNCHSPAMFHDLRLRGGALGSFSSLTIRSNYERARALLSVDAPDPNQSRLIAKNLCPPSAGGAGLLHRGGALLEDFGGCASEDSRARAELCAGIDADGGELDEIPAYCVLTRWHALERAAAIERGELPSSDGPSAVVFVARPQGIGGIADFDVFRPGADLLWADVTLDADGGVELSGERSLLAGCGLGPEPDVRGPTVSWDASTIAFAARASAGEPLRIYEVQPDGGGCAQKSELAPADDARGGILVHDFDPTYTPDDRLVFASTRGNLAGASDVRGPTRTPASLAPNANLYVFEPERDGSVRQLTFLLNQELAPSMMTDGRLIFSAEKRGLDFHQFAARRMNLDGGDYHPLMAQRPSLGFAAATEVVELPNKNLAFVGSELDAADGGGAIVVINRSIGPDQDDRDPADRSYIHSSSEPFPGAGAGELGAFRSPAPLPSGRLLAACDLTAADLAAGPRHYALCELELASGSAPRVIWTDQARIALEPAVVWAREPRAVYESRADEPNGSTRVEPGGDDAIVHYLDVPLLGTLLFENTRTGRPLRSDVKTVTMYESRSPPQDADSFSELGSRVVRDQFGEFYQELRELGRADLHADGSLRVRIPGGVPLIMELGDAAGSALQFDADDPFSGTLRQREDVQFYPGERAKQSMPRRLFNGVCAGCHGSVSGRELDVAVDVDVLTGASRTQAGDDLIDLR